MHSLFSSLWVDPGTLLQNPQEPRGSGTVLVFPFFPTGEGNCLVLETTLLDLGDIPTGFVQGSGIGME